MKTKILIAEDEPLMRERLIMQLTKLWPQAEIVMVAENGNDAWDGYLEHEPDLVLLDIRMPGLSGIEVAQRIGKNAQIIFITAYDQYAIDAFDAGAIDYLLKPVQEERLQKAIERVQDKLRNVSQNALHTTSHDLTSTFKSLQAAALTTKPETIKWIKASVGN